MEDGLKDSLKLHWSSVDCNSAHAEADAGSRPTALESTFHFDNGGTDIKVALRSMFLVAAFAGAVMSASAQGGGSYRIHCQMPGTPSVEPMGADRALQTLNFVCNVEGGPMDGSIMTGSQLTDFTGVNGKSTSGVGIIRKADGALVYETGEGGITLSMADGKVIGMTGAGKSTYKSAYGSLEPQAGKAYRWTGKTTGPLIFILDVTPD